MSFLFYSVAHNETLILLTFVVLGSDTLVSWPILDSLYVGNDSFYLTEQSTDTTELLLLWH